MAQPKIYNVECKDVEHKPVNLRLVYAAGNTILCAVDEEGETIVDLITFESYGVYSQRGAFDMLKQRGYDTTFANWDAFGSMMVSR